MSDEVQETFIREYLGCQHDGDLTLDWQGDEPTLLGLGFYRRTVELAERYRRLGQRVSHTIQTNDTLLTDERVALLDPQHEPGGCGGAELAVAAGRGALRSRQPAR